MASSEDLSAIDRYFRTHPLKTAEAFQIKDAFIRWYDNLSWYDKNVVPQAIYDEARTRRNQLNIANQPTAQGKAEIRKVLATGQTTEEQEGGKRPPIDPQSGRVGTQVTKPTVHPTPSTQPKPGSPQVGGQGSAPVALTRVLVMGTSDDGRGDVKTWQQFLGIVPATGYYGQATVDKTIAFQKSRGLTPDGKVGQLTWAAAFPPNAAPALPPDAFAPEPEKRSESLKPSAKPSSGGAKPKPVQPSPKPTANNTKPAIDPVKPKGESKAKQATRKVKEKAKQVAQAGILDVSSWPPWAKAAGIITVIGGAALAAAGKKPLL